MCSVMWEAILYKGVCSGQPSGFLYYNMIIRIKMAPQTNTWGRAVYLCGFIQHEPHYKPGD